MTKVSVNAPRTPVTEGSSGIAAATLPNVCKMPGPPAPFVPTPLPNIGKSGTSPKGYSKTVTIEGKKVAIKGASFGSKGDVASKGTGGGLLSSNVEGPTSFVGPGAMSVKIEGKNVQLLGDPMFNNCGPSGTPANAATMQGVVQENGDVTAVTGEEPCPLNASHEPHGPLEETEQTKTDASQLASMLEAVLTEKGHPLASMIGVVQCWCGKKKYADHSNVTLAEFCEAVKRLKDPWRSPPSSLSLNEILGKKTEKEKEDIAKKKAHAEDESANRIRDSLLKRFSHSTDVVEDNWLVANNRAHESFQNRFAKTPPAAAYPPGFCAAQKAIVLVWDSGAYPGALTERWFHSKGGKTQGWIKFFDAKKNDEDTRPFENGKSVPPCRTCELILPIMICPGDEKPQCDHKD